MKIIDHGLRPDDFGLGRLDSVGWRSITPNADGDWINQRSDVFGTLLPLHDDDEPSVFTVRGRGLLTARDAWNYNSSRSRLEANTRRMIAHYNAQVGAFQEAHPTLAGTQKERAEVAKKIIDLDPTAFSWDRADFGRLVKGKTYDPRDADYRVATYRPFDRRWVNVAPIFNNTAGKIRRTFPHPDTDNLVIVVSTKGARNPFTVFITRDVPDVHPWVDDVPYLPLCITSNRREADQTALFDEAASNLTSTITEHALTRFRQVVPDFTDRDVFFTVYAILHAQDYRDAFAADLKRSLPRIPVPDDASVLKALAAAGRDLANLHLHFESADIWSDLDYRTRDAFDSENPAHLRVQKMRYAKQPNPDDPGGRKVDDPTTIVFNDFVTITDIPVRAHEYRLGSRSALDWVVEQQQVKTDQKSGITNDPNDWATEHGDPRYILDLVGRVVTVSMRTLDIIDGLPSLGVLR